MTSDTRTPSVLPALSDSRLLRFVVLSALYLAQSVPGGFINVAVVLWLEAAGLSDSAIGAIVATSTLPWVLKLVWGPLFDRIAWTPLGRRRPVIVPVLLLMGLCVLSLLAVDPARHIAALTAVLFVLRTLTSVQDVATDALAVDLLQPGEHGRANGLMLGSKTVGIAMGGGGGLVLAKYIGWSAVMLAMAAVIFAVMVLVALVRERPRGPRPERAAAKRFRFRTLWQSFASRAALGALVIAFSSLVGYPLISVVWLTQLAHWGVSYEAIGAATGIADPIAGVTGALAAGWFADRLGARWIVGGAMGAVALLLAVWALAGPSMWTWVPFLAAWSFAITFSYNVVCAPLFGYLMRISNPAVGATQFAVFMAAFNLATFVGLPTGAALSDGLGAPATFIIAAGVQFLAIALVPLCMRRE